MANEQFEMEMMGFGCASCAYTIEKLGKKIDGIDAIKVNLGDNRITVEHHGDKENLAEQISSIVDRIGHDVKLID